MQHMPMMAQIKVKGMTTYNTICKFALDCVLDHAYYCNDQEQYTLEVSDLPDFKRHEFAALLMAYEPDFINEACGADNQHFDTKMVPALLNYLRNSTDKDAQIAFTETWRDCTTSYLANVMQEYIDNALVDYNRG
jgi:hypothetical protein